jgi:hypothetical protein
MREAKEETRDRGKKENIQCSLFLMNAKGLKEGEEKRKRKRK